MGRPASAVTHYSLTTSGTTQEQALPNDVKAIHIKNTHATNPMKFILAEKGQGATPDLTTVFYQVDGGVDKEIDELALLGYSLYYEQITGPAVVKVAVLH